MAGTGEILFSLIASSRAPRRLQESLGLEERTEAAVSLSRVSPGSHLVFLGASISPFGLPKCPWSVLMKSRCLTPASLY